MNVKPKLIHATEEVWARRRLESIERKNEPKMAEMQAK